MQRIDISQISGRVLRVFLTVYDEKSVSRAAEVLNSSQSTVSHNLEKLRGLLGDTLFVQSGRGIVPSARADALAPKVRRILVDLEALADQGIYDPVTDPDPFVIALSTSILDTEMETIAKALRASLPQKHVIFRDLGTSGVIEPLLDSRHVDVVLTLRPRSYPNTLSRLPLFQDHMRVFYDPNARGPVSSVEDYCAAAHATVAIGQGRKSLLQGELDALSIHRRIVLGAPNLWALIQLMRGTDMIASLPARVARTAGDVLASSPFPIDLAPMQFDMVWHRRYANSARLEWLLMAIKTALSERSDLLHDATQQALRSALSR
ncbi:LysR family transcriptional regulator [Epibacterium sp. Ofav1-8]|uniref:LysR family transcriptional regulator n=1 Tax=Epibacterium sp. Ofav1-8 TaxID=2917735 RepID=UPI001EF72A50|nr:LysR family transcriptional regulator [Epibacterium sp. Ofav1-8]